MTTTQPAFVPAVVAPDFDSFAVRQAIAGFLAGYGDTTRDVYSLDLRQWLRWCTSHELRVTVIDECPRCSITARGWAPSAMSSEAQVCRRSWIRRPGSRPASVTASFHIRRRSWNCAADHPRTR